MIALCIIAVVLLLILILPVGVDASYLALQASVKVKAGPLCFQILPAKEKKPKKPKKNQKKKPKPAEGHEKEKEKGKQKATLTFDDIVELAKLALTALGRFRRCLSVDLLMLHLTAASADPCDAVMLYGRVNAALGALRAPAHRALKIRREDLRTAVDFDAAAPEIDARIVATIQIWEILYIGICAAAAFLRWYCGKKRTEKQRRKQLKAA